MYMLASIISNNAFEGSDIKTFSVEWPVKDIWSRKKVYGKTTPVSRKAHLSNIILINAKWELKGHILPCFQYTGSTRILLLVQLYPNGYIFLFIKFNVVYQEFNYVLALQTEITYNVHVNTSMHLWSSST